MTTENTDGKKPSRRGHNGPPPVRGVRGQDSIAMQQGLREFLDRLYDERVMMVHPNDPERHFTRRLTITEIKERVAASGYQLSRRKIGEDRFDLEITLAEQRRIQQIARTLVAEGAEDNLNVQSATNQVLAAKLLDLANNIEALTSDNAWIVDKATSLERAGARTAAMKAQRDRGAARASLRIMASIREYLKGDPQLLAAMTKIVDRATQAAREELK